MKNKPKINSLDIRCFRGLKNLSLTDLSNINIFVGGNNTGKTSVLEAVKLMSAPYDITMLKNVALQRISGSSARRKNILEAIKNTMCKVDSITATSGYLLKAEIESESSGRADISTNSLEIKTGIREYFDENGQLRKSLYIEYFKDENDNNGCSYIIDDDGKTHKINDNKFRIDNGISNSKLYDVQYMYTASDYYDHYIKMLSEHMISKGKKGILNIIRSFDDSVNDINVLNDEIYLRNESNDTSLPLYVYGAGLQKAVFMSIAVSYCRNGVILIDEVDNALNISAFRNVFSWFIKACIDNNVQAFLTTHSAEALDEIIAICQENYSQDDILRVVTLRKNKNGDSIAKIRSGNQAYEFRSDYRMELRI